MVPDRRKQKAGRPAPPFPSMCQVARPRVSHTLLARRDGRRHAAER